MKTHSIPTPDENDAVIFDMTEDWIFDVYAPGEGLVFRRTSSP